MGHSTLVIFCHLLKEGTSYTEQGCDFFDRPEPERLICCHVRRLESLGHKVKLKTCVAA